MTNPIRRHQLHTAPARPIRYVPYAFHETAGGVLGGRYGDSHPAGEGIEVAAVEPFLNRRGDFDKTPGFDAVSLLMAGAWLSRHTGRTPVYSIGFEDEWTGAAGQAAAWASPTADAPDAGVCVITRGASLRGEPLNVWLDAPPERAASYLQWFSQVSVDVQTALRRWLPYLLLREDAVLNDRDLRASLLFYAATRPYQAKVRGAFTWDVICPDSMSSVFRSGSQNLPVVLEQAQRYALAGGRLDLTQALAPTETASVLIPVRRDPRALKALLTLEARLIEALLALAEKGYTLSRTTTSPKNLHRFCGTWARGVQTRLRRVLGPVGLPGLADLVLVEGTASLARCTGRQAAKSEWTEFRAISTLAPPASRDLPRAA